MKLPRNPSMTFEHSLLRTATLCLIAFGAVMVYSASSGTSLLNGGGDSSMYLKRYLMSAALGLVALGFFSPPGVAAAKRYTPALRAARMARDLYSKLLAAGITSVILIQATVNFFAVLGVLPLTGVPLPFISYGNSNLVVLLAGMGILINVAQRPARKARLRVVEGARGKGKVGIRK